MKRIDLKCSSCKTSFKRGQAFDTRFDFSSGDVSLLCSVCGKWFDPDGRIEMIIVSPNDHIREGETPEQFLDRLKLDDPD